ncbi:hypothetical protein [uncultured Tenacibaculum sp.]|uniref:hypothetical protein n=1 Tax=uncultured Tenacibaculum sp. TaxID=174713 RepID=UPI00260296E7|nr:hypothetical protein [uncultured Tenacibaculum sp.]
MIAKTKLLSIYTLVLLICIGCTNEEEINSKPSNFTVQIENLTLNSVKVFWTESKDNDGQAVFYDLFLNESKIFDNKQVLEYVFNDLEYNKNYKGEIIASDPDGNTISKQFDFTTGDKPLPSNFNVSVVEKDAYFSKIEWTASSDNSSNDKILYDIYLDNELLEENRSELYFYFPELKGLQGYSGKVVAKNSQGFTISRTFSFTTNLKVYDNTLSISSQSDVNEFIKGGYNIIDGSLFIGNSSGIATDIKDISGFKSVREIKGEHIRIQNTICESLKGLENAKASRRFVRIEITDNEELEHINEFFSVDYVTYAYVAGNSKMKSIDGFKKIKYLSQLNLVLNESLTSLSGLSNFESFNSLTITNNESLENLNGLENLKSVFDGFGQFTITNNDSLVNLNGLENFKEAKLLVIGDNKSLENLEALTVSNINNLVIRNNDKITSLKGLETLEKNIYLTIRDNENLVNLSGLENIRNIRDSYDHELIIINNKKLENLDALANFWFVKGRLLVEDNGLLNDLCGITKLAKEGEEFGYFTIIDNLFNPTKQNLIDGNCSQ